MHLPRFALLISTVAFSGLLTAGFGINPAQEQTGTQKPGPPGTIRVRIALVPVDVVVTDDRDRPVTDLKPEDFRIFENGRRQEIGHFSVQAYSPMMPEPAKPSTIRMVPTLELAPQTSRTFLILLGRWPPLTAGGYNQTVKAVDALLKFVRNGLLSQDKAAVYAYGRATDFTTDHGQIVRVLEQYKKVADKVESWLQLNLRGFNAI